jgi:hypothetical protein
MEKRSLPFHARVVTTISELGSRGFVMTTLILRFCSYPQSSASSPLYNVEAPIGMEKSPRLS